MKKIIIISLLAISLPFSVACSSFTDVASAPEALSEPVVEINNATTYSTAIVENAGPLTEQEISDLVYMREEEKLAHDVYTTLYEYWGLPVFKNIAASEQTHTESVQYLLDFYNIDDPTTGLALGQFANDDLQALYDQLVEQGSRSLADALKVGAAIEEIDILDLLDALDSTAQLEIVRIYENLLQGSYNHLRAFANTINQQTGESYQPQYLSEEDYQAIIDGSFTSGMGMGTQGQPMGRGRGNPNRN